MKDFAKRNWFQLVALGFVMFNIIIHWNDSIQRWDFFFMGVIASLVPLAWLEGRRIDKAVKDIAAEKDLDDVTWHQFRKH